MSYYYVPPEGGSRPPRVHFSQDDQQNYTHRPIQRPYHDTTQLSRRRREPSGDEYAAPERVHIPYSYALPWTRLERRVPSTFDERTQQPVILPPYPSLGRRMRSRQAETIITPRVHEEDEAIPASPVEAKQQNTLPYSHSPPRMQSQEDDDVDSWQRRSRRVPDRGSDRARSISPVRRYYDEGPRAYVYKSGDADVYAMDEEQPDRVIRPPSPIGGDLDAYDEFNFLFPKSQSTDGDLSDLESPAVESDSVHIQDPDMTGAPAAKRIYSSLYMGGFEPGGAHSAKLRQLLDTRGLKRPLFKWLHIRQKVMNFDDFWVEISRQTHFSELERNAIAKLRADVKKHCIKTRQNPKGARVGYMEPRYFEVPLKSFSKHLSGQEKTSGSARWICLPYFSLEKYSGLLSGSHTSSFPPQTLLQAQYSRTGQQRDMLQAVCQVSTTSKSECFHIAQLWCLVLDNSLIVTCGTMSELDLQGDIVDVKSQPAPETAEGVISGRIVVQYGNAVIWSLPAMECSTWFTFLSNFHSFWPGNLEFRYNNQIITATTWPKVVRIAARPQGSVTLKMDIMPRPSLPRTPLEVPVLNSVGSEPSKSREKTQDYLHVLTLLPTEARPTTNYDAQRSLEALKPQLSSADNFLSGQTSYSDQRAYKNCREATREDVCKYLNKQVTEVKEKASDHIRIMHEDRVDIFNAADVIFQLFFPIEFDGPTTRKYWGAIKALLKIPELDGEFTVVAASTNQNLMTEIRTILRDMAQDVLLFENVMSYASEKERGGIDLPRQFVTAWLHVVSGLISVNDRRGTWLAHVSKAKVLMLEGMHRIIHGISNRNLLDSSVVLPLEIVSLFSLTLLHDQVGKADDIMDTYSQYLTLLDAEITSQPSDRSYQHRIDLLQQEMTIIKKTVAKQRSVLASIRANFTLRDGGGVSTGVLDEGLWHGRRAREAARWRDEHVYPIPPPYNNQPHDRGTRKYDVDYIGLADQEPADLEAGSKLSPVDELGFRGLFLNECIELVEQRELDLRRHTDYADDLERAVVYGLDWTKDRQENAIYAFTIVTVVFLPLSAISSIFGMNTTDIRDMEFGQWLYWAVAIPVTLIIIVIGLWWMGELGNVLKWLSGRPTDRLSNTGYLPGVPRQMADRTAYVVDAPSIKAEVDNPGSRMADGGLSRPVSYLSEKGPVMLRARRPQPVIRY